MGRGSETQLQVRENLNKLTDIGTETTAETSTFANVSSQIKQIFNFHALEVVGRGSETQLQVRENLNKLTDIGTETTAEKLRMFHLHLTKYSIFTHLKLWVAVARHNFKCVKI